MKARSVVTKGGSRPTDGSCRVTDRATNSLQSLLHSGLCVSHHDKQLSMHKQQHEHQHEILENGQCALLLVCK